MIQFEVNSRNFGGNKMIYLDNGATTPIHERVKNKILYTLSNDFGNPSSLHQLGIDAEKRLKEARNEVAKLFLSKEKNVIFTSGGSESNNLAIKGVLNSYKNRGNHLIISAIEHASVYNQAKKLIDDGFVVDILPVDEFGFVDENKLKELIRKDTVLVSIMHVNNEVGTIQDLKKLGELIKECNSKTFFHVDAVASFGKIPMKISEWKADLVSVSGHKIHAPKGIGALYIKDGLNLKSLIDGGSQEFGMRAGTENTIGIIAFGEACKIINESDLTGYLEKTKDLYNYLEDRVTNEIEETRINGAAVITNGVYTNSPYVINLSFKGVKAETLLHFLAGRNIYVSTSSACSSKDSKQNSRILKEMNVPKDFIDGSIRVSFSRETTKDEIAEFIKILKEGLEMLRMFRR